MNKKANAWVMTIAGAVGVFSAAVNMIEVFSGDIPGDSAGIAFYGAILIGVPCLLVLVGGVLRLRKKETLNQ